MRFSDGDEIKVDALKRAATNKNEATVTLLFEYKILNSPNGDSLYAAQPVNIKSKQ